MMTLTHSSERQHIEAEMGAVETELAHLAERLADKPEWTLGGGDPAVSEWEMNFTLKQGAEHRLKLLQVALQKLEQGLYAICEICKQPIDPERLAIVPETARCVQCARKKW